MPILMPPAAEVKPYIYWDVGGAAGSQQITGVGFKPKIVIFICRAIDGVQVARSWGFDDGSTAQSIYVEGDTNYVLGYLYESIYIYRNASNYARAHITSMDSDGFTLYWDVVGTCYVEFYFLCLK